MTEHRLNIWIPEELRDYLAERSEHEGRGMNVIVAELVREDLARRQGEIIEQQSLPIIREIVQTELRKLRSELMTEVVEAMNLDVTNEIKLALQRSDNRHAALLVRVLRDAGIALRLSYALLQKGYGTEIARKVFEEVKEQVGKEIARPSKSASQKEEPKS